MIKPNTIVQYKDSFGIHYGIVEKDKGSKVHTWELSNDKGTWVKTLMNRDIPKSTILNKNVDRKKLGKIIGENKMKKSQLRQIIREEIRRIKEAVGGTMEVLNTPVDDAMVFADKIGLDLTEIPNFEQNYNVARSLCAKYGKTKRSDMPVINPDDVKHLQARLVQGYIDINKPFAKDTEISNPFPEGLSGKQAKAFLQRGFKDGSEKDDVVDARVRKFPIGKLKPIQKQIYTDKSLKSINISGPKGFIKFATTAGYFITSADGFIIDGHHRWLSALMVDPKMQVQCFVINLPIKKLLPLSLAYGDAIGNNRNS